MPMHPNTIRYLRNRERCGNQPTKLPAIKAARMIQKGWKAYSRYLDNLEPVWYENEKIPHRKWRNIHYDLIKRHNKYTQSKAYQREKAKKILDKKKIPSRQTRSKRKLEWIWL
jgi:hypothetical protein